MPNSQQTPLANAGTARLVTTDGTQLDPTVVKLMKGIKIVESNGDYNAKGKSGEFGAYQFLPTTYAGAAPKYGIDPTDTSPAAQNKVAYFQLKSFKDKGFTPEQAAAAWNGGEGVVQNDRWKTNVGTNSKGVAYNTPDYVQKVISAAKGQQLPGESPAPAPETPSIGGFAGNVVKSGANFIGNTADALLHPIQTLQSIGGAAVGGLQELGGQANDNTQKFDNLVNFFKDRYGGVDKLQHTLYTDPVGFAADLSAVLTGGETALGRVGAMGAADASRAASLAGKTGIRTMAQDAGVGNTATRGAELLGRAADAVNPISALASGAGKLIPDGIGAGIASKVTGLEPQTLRQIGATPGDFTREAISAGASGRKAIADEVVAALDKRSAALSETGSEYAPIREAKTPIGVSRNFLDKQISEVAGVNIENGRVASTASAKVRDARDVRALQNLYDTYSPVFKRGAMTTDEYLNFRTDLAKLAKFERDIGKSSDLESVAAQIRGKFNDTYRGNIPGLKELDERFSSQIGSLNELKAGLIKSDGTLMANGINKIARAIGTGKDQTLGQLEQIIPGITQRLKVQAAIEDIEKAAGNKVGTYTKSGLEVGGIALGITTGNIHILAGAVATAILASPDIAVPIMRVFGFNKDLVHAVTANLGKAVVTPTVLNTATTKTPDTTDQSGLPQPADTTIPSSPDATPAP